MFLREDRDRRVPYRRILLRLRHVRLRFLRLREFLSDDRLGFNQGWLAIAICFRLFDGSKDGIEVVAIHLHGVPSESGKAGAGVVALSHIGHRVERDVV